MELRGWQQRTEAVSRLLHEGRWVEPSPHLLLRRLGLSDEQQAFVWTLAGLATDHTIYWHVSSLAGDIRAGISIAQFLRYLPAASPQGLLTLTEATHPLRRHGLLLFGPEPTPHLATPVRLHPRMLAALGDDLAFVDEALAPAVLASSVSVLPILSEAQEKIFNELALLVADATPQLIALKGVAGTGRGLVARYALGQAHASVLSLDCRALAAVDLQGALAALEREFLLAPKPLVLEHVDELLTQIAQNATAMYAFTRLMSHRRAPILMTAGEKLSLEIGMHSFDWPVPDALSREPIWRRELGLKRAISDENLAYLSHRYPLGSTAIMAAIATAKAGRTVEFQPDIGDLVYGIRANVQVELSALATKIKVTQEWRDLVLPPETAEDVQVLLERSRQAHTVLNQWGFGKKMGRGTGIAALFSGPPGTGKTMVASLLAGQLGLELYQVDLANIVSKWIGETEKQLAKLFDAAEAGHALLLFDEADALFAKRTVDVRSATDKYANLEVNFLLQRIERYNGIVILTTNLDSSMDPALRRRLAAHIVFTAPDEPERAKLWERMLPVAAPVADGLDFKQLAVEYRDMTGANIRNAVIAAAFLAAADGQAISQQHLIRAARSEYRAMGRVLAHRR